MRLIKEKKQQTEEDSEEYRNLEDERRVLRKNLIDLDYQHKMTFEQYKKRNQEIERERAEERARQL